MLHVTELYLQVRGSVATLLDRARHEAGEGVISAAIVVLIMAILGAAMWAAFNEVFTGASDQIQAEVDSIGGG